MPENSSFRHAVDARLSGLSVSDAQRAAMLARARAPRRRAWRLIPVPAALLLALLLSTTACAGMYFGVLDFHIGQRENPAFLEHIRDIDAHYESDYLAADVHQALFDGVSLSLALDVRRKDPAEGMYIYPHIAARSGERTLSVQIDSFTNDSMACSVMGSASLLLGTDGQFGITASLLSQEDGAQRYDSAASPVLWTVVLDVLSPREPLEMRDVEFLSEAPDAERFTIVDTLSFPLATEEMPVKTLSAPQEIDLGDGYTLTVHALTLTFDRADYAFEVNRSGEPSAAALFGRQEGHWSFGVLSPEGRAEYSGGSSGMRGDGVYYNYSISLTAPVDELTFVPVFLTPGQEDEMGMTAEDEIFLGQYAYSPEELERAFTLSVE